MTTKVIIIEFAEYEVDFRLDDKFFEHYGDRAWGYYAAAVDRGRSGHFATIYLPVKASRADGIGTLAHEVTRLVDDWLQHEYGVAGLLRTELRAAMVGNIITAFIGQVTENSV